MQRSPYTAATRTEFDPQFGVHDDFLMIDRYIFAQVLPTHSLLLLSLLLLIYLFIRKQSIKGLPCMSVMIVNRSSWPIYPPNCHIKIIM